MRRDPFSAQDVRDIIDVTLSQCKIRHLPLDIDELAKGIDGTASHVAIIDEIERRIRNFVKTAAIRYTGALDAPHQK